MKPVLKLLAAIAVSAFFMGAKCLPAQGEGDAGRVEIEAARWLAEYLAGRHEPGPVAWNTTSDDVSRSGPATDSLLKILGAASVMSCGGRQSTCPQGDFGTIVT